MRLSYHSPMHICLSFLTLVSVNRNIVVSSPDLSVFYVNTHSLFYSFFFFFLSLFNTQVLLLSTSPSHPLLTYTLSHTRTQILSLPPAREGTHTLCVKIFVYLDIVRASAQFWPESCSEGVGWCSVYFQCRKQGWFNRRCCWFSFEKNNNVQKPVHQL